MSYISSIKLDYNDTLAVFAYEFPHRKTFDFLQLIRSQGFTKVVVFAAPKKLLKNQDNTSYFSKPINYHVIEKTSELCIKLGFDYISCNHENIEKISHYINERKIRFGIISGARIIKPEIINLFMDGILNIHPGKLPETAGLDALYYTIKYNLPAGVTVHTINHKVDEGDLIDFVEYDYSGIETIGELSESLYHCQLTGLIKFFKKALAEGVVKLPIYRPFKNEPMQMEEKLNIITYFGNWRSHQHQNQTFRKLSSICEKGSISDYLIIDPYLNQINLQVKNDWTPLILAVFNQNIYLARYLINNGADVNYQTKKGTTVLMYAKTPLINNESVSYETINDLLDAGANIQAYDIFGKNIFDYVEEKDDLKLLSFLKGYEKCNL